jgi:hypothetical protein
MRLNEAWKQVSLNESAVKSLSRMLHHFSNHDIAIITAFRGKDANGNDVDKDTNLKNNKILRKSIESAGYGFVRVKGAYIETNAVTGEKYPVEEHSFFIIDRNRKGESVGGLKDAVIDWGKHWNQDAVIFKPAGEKALLIGTNNNPNGVGIGNEITIGGAHINQPAEYYTRLHGGRTFNFSEDVDISKYESYMTQRTKESVIGRLYKK